jgi:mono/diheme cytochrome c family protein
MRTIVRSCCLLMLGCALTGCAPSSPSAPTAGSRAPTTGNAPTAVAPAAAGEASVASARGERIYSGNCVPCHQETGKGIPGVYPNLSGSPVVLGDPAELALWVLKGLRPPSMPTGRYPTQMLQFGWMKPADAAALFTYVCSNFGNSAAPVDAATVSKALGQ